MAYDEKLADRIREALSALPDVKEKKMFGSLAFMVDDKMCITAGADRIMCRIDPALHEDLIQSKDCQPVFMKGKEYKGFVHVDADRIKNKKDFNYWIELALDYNKRAKSSKKQE
jgi:TfoX/Sxy family transcriptional regulator of competence genes